MEIEQKRDTLKSQLIALEKERERLLKIREQGIIYLVYDYDS